MRWPLLLLMLGTLPLAGTDFIWNGNAGDGDWTKANNWTINSGYPDGSGDTATIATTSDAISVPAGLVIGALTLNDNYQGTLTLSGSLTLDSASGKNGDLTTSGGGSYIFDANNQTIVLDGSLLLGGGTFNNPSSISVGNDGSGDVILTDVSYNKSNETITLNGNGNFGIDSLGDRMNTVQQANGITTTLTGPLRAAALITGDATSTIQTNGSDRPIIVYDNDGISDNGALFLDNGGNISIFSWNISSFSGGNFNEADITLYNNSSCSLSGAISSDGYLSIYRKQGDGTTAVSSNGYAITMRDLFIGRSGDPTDAGTLTLTGNSALTLTNDLFIYADDSSQTNALIVDSAGTSPIEIGGSWTVQTNAHFDAQASTVSFVSGAADESITSQASPFYHLIFDDQGAGAATWTLQDSLDVDGDLSLTDGILDLNSQNISVAGSLSLHATNGQINSAVGNPSLTMDGTGNVLLDVGTDDTNHDFEVLAIAKTSGGRVDISGSDLTINDSITISSGELRILTGRILTVTAANAVTVASGATISGDGTLDAPLTLVDGAILAPGDAAIGSLATDTLILANASVLPFSCDAPGTSDQVTVTGDLTLDGELTISNAGSLAAGSYTLFTYTGSLTDYGLAINMPSGFGASIDTSTANQVNLVVREARYWVGGGGNWNETEHWASSSDGTGGASLPDANTLVYFDANSGAGTASLIADVSVEDLDCSGYTGSLADAGFTLSIADDVILGADMSYNSTGVLAMASTSSNATLTSNGVLLGVLSISGSQDVNLANTCSASALQINTISGINLTGSTLTLRSGILTRNDVSGVEADVTIACPIVVGAAEDWTVSPSDGMLIVSGVIDDGGNGYQITKNGGGTIKLTGANTWTGNFKINRGLGLLSNSSGSATGSGDVTMGWGDEVGGTGSISGKLVIQGYCDMDPGEFGVGPLTAGSLDVHSSANLNFQLGTSSDQLVITGDITDWRGIINVTDAGDLVPDRYTIVTYGGSLTNNGAYVGSMPAGLAGSLDYSTQNQIDLVVQAFTDRYWVGGGADSNWSTADNWASSTGGAGGASVPDYASRVSFDANSGSGLVNMDADFEILSIDCSGYTGSLADNDFTLTLHGDATFVSDMTLTATGTLNMDDGGTLTTGGQTLFNLTATRDPLVLGDDLTVAGAINVHNGDLTWNGRTVTLSGAAQSHDLSYDGYDYTDPMPSLLRISGAGSSVLFSNDTNVPSFELLADCTLDREVSGQIRPGGTSGSCTIAAGVTLTLADNAHLDLKRDFTFSAGAGSSIVGAGELHWRPLLTGEDVPASDPVFDVDVTLGVSSSYPDDATYSIPAGRAFGKNLFIEKGKDPLHLTFAGDVSIGQDLYLRNDENDTDTAYDMEVILTDAASISIGGDLIYDKNSGSGLTTWNLNSNTVDLSIDGSLLFSDTFGTLVAHHGAGTWTIAGNVDLTGVDTWSHDNGTTELTASSAPVSLTSAGQALYQLQLSTANAITLADAANVYNLIWNTTNAVSLSGSVLTLRSGNLSRNDVTGAEGIQSISSDLVLGASGSWTVNSSDGQLAVSGVVSDGGNTYGIEKTGAGSLNLSGANTYAGTTAVSAGTLVVSNVSGSGTGTDAVSVASGATLSGTGSLSGLVTIQDGGIIAPGDGGSGTLTCNGGLSMDASSTSAINLELGTSSDQIVVNGNMTLAGVINVTAVAGFTTTSYTIATYTGSYDGSSLAIGSMPAGYWATITDDGSNITLTVTAGSDYVWDGDSDADGDGISWSDPLNWTADSGYPDDPSDTVTIAATDNVIVTPGALSIGALTLNDPFTGSLTLAGSLTLSTASGETGALLLDGTPLNYTLSTDATGNHAVSIAGTYTQNGGDFFANNSNIEIAGNVFISDITNIFDAGTSTVRLTGSATMSNARKGNWFYHLHQAAGITTTLVNPLAIGGSLDADDGTAVITDDGSGSIRAINSWGATINGSATFIATDADDRPLLQITVQSDANPSSLTGDFEDTEIRCSGSGAGQQSGAVTCAVLSINGNGSSWTTSDFDLTITYALTVGYPGNPSRSATFTAGSSNISIGGDMILTDTDIGIENTFAADTATITLGDDWTIGTNNLITNTGATVIFNHTSNTQFITSNGTIMPSITVNKAANSVALQDHLIINGSVGITAGTLDANGFAMQVDGSWSKTGGSFLSGGSLTFASSSSATWDSGGTDTASDFGNVIVDKASGSLSVTGNDVQINGTLDVDAGSLLIGDGRTLTATGAVSTATGATLGGSGSLAGSISNAGTINPTGGDRILDATTADCASGGGIALAIGGYVAGTSHDQLAVSGALSLGGTSLLDLDLNGLASAGSASGVVTAGSISVLPAAVSVQNAGSYLVCVDIDATSIDVHITDQALSLSRHTLDRDGDGQIDAIRITTDWTLNDDFSDLDATVSGYTVTGFSADTAGDGIFYIELTESGSADTGNTPAVRLISNGSLQDSGSSAYLPTDGSAQTPTDGAAPILMSASWSDAGDSGVSSSDTVSLTFSEDVTTASALIADLLLPVTGDDLSSTSITNTTATVHVLTLAGTPLLCPGGSYSSAAINAGDPSGIGIADGTRITDAAGLTAASNNAASSIDLGPSTTTLGLTWNTGNNPKSWPLGTFTLDSTANTVDDSMDLVVRNSGDCSSRLRIACANSSPSTWTPGGSSGSNTFVLKANGGTAPGSPALAGSYPLTLGTSEQTLVGLLRSGALSDWQLFFHSPTAITIGAGAPQSITVTVTAEVPP